MKARIKEIRKSKGITQKELAARLGVVPSAVSQFENSDNNIKIETLEKIAKALDCSIVDLIDKSDYENAAPADKRKVLDIAFDEAKTQANKAYDVSNIAGYIWILPDKEDGFIHLLDKKTNIEYAVSDELFTAAVDGSLDYINYNFEKLMKSAKVVKYGNETEKTS